MSGGKKIYWKRVPKNAGLGEGDHNNIMKSAANSTPVSITSTKKDNDNDKMLQKLKAHFSYLHTTVTSPEGQIDVIINQLKGELKAKSSKILEMQKDAEEMVQALQRSEDENTVMRGQLSAATVSQMNHARTAGSVCQLGYKISLQW
uniref:t-SNARE coiled-coil homology domain-containing protein n=1 Tax=Panagrellus redivivus TaxID=6233 RepID=A0A7E4WCL1_PANRE